MCAVAYAAYFDMKLVYMEKLKKLVLIPGLMMHNIVNTYWLP